jgi:hypothetical protein
MSKTSVAAVTEPSRGQSPVRAEGGGGRRSAKWRSSAGDVERSRGDDPDAPRSGSGLLLWLIVAALLVAGVGILLVSTGIFERSGGVAQSPTARPIPARYSPQRAMNYMRQLCELGPRPSGSAAMARQQQLLESFFRGRGAEVRRQSFETRNPNDGSPVTMTNLIASWHPERPIRVLFCAHYDTRPFPDRDPVNPRGVFVGANDGASGTAGLMELANQFEDLPADIGVDLVLFDGEEFVWQESRDRYFLGSTYFANEYKNNPPEVPYRCGILLDMIGDKELRIYYEGNSLRYAKSVARSFWTVAERLGVRAFVPRRRHTIRDDHLPLNQIARIPTIDVIDFDYPRPGIGVPQYWHTEQDVVENCSGESVAAVVWVAHQWLLAQTGE